MLLNSQSIGLNSLIACMDFLLLSVTLNQFESQEKK